MAKIKKGAGGRPSQDKEPETSPGRAPSTPLPPPKSSTPGAPPPDRRRKPPVSNQDPLENK